MPNGTQWLEEIFREAPVSGKALRGWLRTNFPRWMWETYSGAEILRALRAAGKGIRTQDFYAIRRQVLATPVHEEDLQSLPDDVLIPRRWFREDHGLSLSTAAHYRFRVWVEDTETGERFAVVRHLATDLHLTPGEAREMMSQYYPRGLPYEGFRVVDVELFDVWAQPGATLERW